MAHTKCCENFVFYLQKLNNCDRNKIQIQTIAFAEILLMTNNNKKVMA